MIIGCWFWVQVVTGESASLFFCSISSTMSVAHLMLSNDPSQEQLLNKELQYNTARASLIWTSSALQGSWDCY